MDNKSVMEKCVKLRKAYEAGLLGNQIMPEDTHPAFTNNEERLSYFTLSMSLNYQRNSYKLWEAANSTFKDNKTKDVFSVKRVSNMDQNQLRELLLKYKLALQPNKHIDTWYRISTTIFSHWGSIEEMLNSFDYDFLKIQAAIQKKYKKGFPYLSGPKIFHYWSYILGEYCDVSLKNKKYIQIAPDTHIIKCSVLLGVITEQEASRMKRDDISERWREVLRGTEYSPIDMHSPLWFWSKNNFKYKIIE